MKYINIKLIYSSSIAAILSVLFATVITIWSEFSPGLKTFLADFSGHHWVSKSIGTMLIYFAVLALVYFMPKNIKQYVVNKSLMCLILTTTLGTIAISLFYIWHYLDK